MVLVLKEDHVLHGVQTRRSFVHTAVAWRLKIALLVVAFLCILPVGLAGGGHVESEAEGGSACQREDGECFNKPVALKLKITAIFAIFLSSSIGVALPLVGRQWSFLQPDSKTLFVAKAFGAGVILATGFIHVLPEAAEKMESSCLPEKPWHKFPWASFFTMVTILAMNLIEFIATSYYEKQAHKSAQDTIKVVASDDGNGIVPVRDLEKNMLEAAPPVLPPLRQESGDWHGIGGHVHGMPFTTEEEGLKKIRSIVVAQVLEFGIASHSVLIGLALGVSFSPCEIRPLLGALTFHQFFEGIALGGCISQAGFRNVSSIVMALIFATTTPLGISLGLGVSNSYNPNSVTALLTEGILDSISGGILIYMALVNLIANEFFSTRLRSDRQLQVTSFISLFLGAAALSTIGIWA